MSTRFSPKRLRLALIYFLAPFCATALAVALNLAFGRAMFQGFGLAPVLILTVGSMAGILGSLFNPSVDHVGGEK